MAKKVVTCRLSESSINNAITRLRAYQTFLNNKTLEFVQALVESGIPVVNANMEKANYKYDSKGVRSGSDTSHYAFVRLNSFGTTFVADLVVQGRELLFIEFGAGIHYNGAVGTSPNPYGAQFGYTIGSYGHGLGKLDQWGYTDETGAYILTHGVKATMPMYKATMKFITDYVKVARRVFRNGWV